MTAPGVRTFFYGSYMNPEVLRGIGLALRDGEVACLPGYDLIIRPLANLVRSERGVVWGIVASMSHADLDRLYAHAREELGGEYNPEAVVAYGADGRPVPALCYLAHDLKTKPPKRDYVERILAAARIHGFPGWYLDRIASFRPPVE